MNAVIGTFTDHAAKPAEHHGHTLGLLLMLTRSRTQSSRGSHAAAILLEYLLRHSRAREGWVRGSRRRIAKAACLTEWEVRVALDQLIQCGWIERRQIADHVSVHYRLTPAFAEALELAGEEVSGIVSQYVRRGNAPIEPPARAPISPDLAEHLRAYAWQHLMQRLLTLNERPKRYARGYSKPVLRGTAITLHWFIQAALQQQGEPRVVSLRGLAQETGLTFRSAKQARARLISWGLLAEQNGAWLLDYTRLAHLLFEEGAELTSAPAVDRRRRSHHDH